VVLADELVHGLRPHPRGQRLRLAAVGVMDVAEEVDGGNLRLGALNGPVINHQSGDAGEVAAVARKENQLVHKGNGGDFQVLGADAQRAYPLEVILACLVIGDNRKALDQRDRSNKLIISMNPPRPVTGTGELC
jgi:hypothetical protein